MRAFKAEGGLELRRDKAGAPVVTDGGHLLLDASFGRISAPEALSDALLAVPGVVQHGLYCWAGWGEAPRPSRHPLAAEPGLSVFHRFC
jgi:ribose 5-phosphate isomerase